MLEYFNEFNNSDKIIIKSISDEFTIALEFELETKDINNISVMDESKLRSLILLNSHKFIKDNYNGNKINNMISIVDNILNDLELDDNADVDYNNEIFDEYLNVFYSDFENKLIQVIQSDYLTYFISDNIDYLTNKVSEHLPNFYRKWGPELKFELDNTLKRGIEFSPITYILGIDKNIEMINDFYSDFDSQKYWIMNNRTGLHINIGFNKKVKWNILKGMIMISDSKQINYVFKDMESRRSSFYTNSLIPNLLKDIKSNNIIRKQINIENISNLEEILGNFILKNLKHYGYKNFGFNLTKIKDFNYVEYRYPGGNISRKVLIDKLYYFCYISYLMIDKNFKRKEYLNKLYKFIDIL